MAYHGCCWSPTETSRRPLIVDFWGLEVLGDLIWGCKGVVFDEESNIIESGECAGACFPVEGLVEAIGEGDVGFRDFPVFEKVGHGSGVSFKR